MILLVFYFIYTFIYRYSVDQWKEIFFFLFQMLFTYCQQYLLFLFLFQIIYIHIFKFFSSLPVQSENNKVQLSVFCQHFFFSFGKRKFKSNELNYLLLTVHTSAVWRKSYGRIFWCWFFAFISFFIAAKVKKEKEAYSKTDWMVSRTKANKYQLYLWSIRVTDRLFRTIQEPTAIINVFSMLINYYV